MATTSIKKSKSPNWKELVRLFRQSGKSEKVFCRELGLNPNSFNYRKRQILAAEQQPGFIPITPAPAPAPTAAQQTELTLELPFGIKLSVRGHLR